MSVNLESPVPLAFSKAAQPSELAHFPCPEMVSVRIGGEATWVDTKNA